MKQIYSIKCNNNRKLKNSKVSYIFNKAIILSITYSIVVVTTVQNLKEKNLLKYEKFLVQWKT